MVKRYLIDEPLDKEVEQFRRFWRSIGMKNVSKTDVIRMLVYKYKDENLNTKTTLPIRKPKSKEWHL